MELNNLSSHVPFRLAETWFWMAYASQDSSLNHKGSRRIQENFGSVAHAVKTFPELNRFDWRGN